MGGQRHVPAGLPPERPGTHCIGGWVGPRAGLDEREKSHPIGIRSPNRPPHSDPLGTSSNCLNAVSGVHDYLSCQITQHAELHNFGWYRNSRTANGSTVVQLNIEMGLLQLYVCILGTMTVVDTFTVRYGVLL